MKKYSLCYLYPYFVLTWFMITGLFNGLCIFLFGSASKIAIDSLLIFGLITTNKNARKFSFNQVIFIIFYLFLTFCSLIMFFRNNHYGFDKLLKNVILTFFSLFNYFILYLTFKEQTFTNEIRKLFSFQLLLEIILFILYVLYNKNTGVLGRSKIQILIFQDWGGRFQGSFSEPSFLGLWLGSCVFISLMTLKKYKYGISSLLIIILYSACKAKFALLAFPVAFLFSIFGVNRFFTKHHIEVIFSCICICLISLSWKYCVEYFFYFISNFFSQDGSATYVTRFGFLWASLQSVCSYPIGHGFGLNYEIFQNLFTDIAPIAQNFGLEIWEIMGYRNNANSMGSKDTLSLIISSTGFLGLILYFNYFQSLLKNKYRQQLISATLISYIFLESIITGNIFSDASFFIVLFAKMALNSNKIRKENNG